MQWKLKQDGVDAALEQSRRGGHLWIFAETPLFRGHQGTLPVELWNAETKVLRGTVAPVFYTAAGEVLSLPNRFDEAIRKIAGAVACLGCKHTQIAVAAASNKGGEL